MFQSPQYPLALDSPRRSFEKQNGGFRYHPSFPSESRSWSIGVGIHPITIKASTKTEENGNEKCAKGEVANWRSLHSGTLLGWGTYRSPLCWASISRRASPDLECHAKIHARCVLCVIVCANPPPLPVVPPLQRVLSIMCTCSAKTPSGVLSVPSSLIPRKRRTSISRQRP